MLKQSKERCSWCLSSEKMIAYHDEYWGKPIHDDQELFAKLVLDLNQAGLSWATILNKQENFYAAFNNFDIQKVANYTEKDRARLLQDAGIIRNRLKVNAAIVNAKAVLEIQKEFGSFDSYLWGFVGGVPEVHTFERDSQLPTSNALSDRLSKDLKRRGFKFVGTTIIYAYLESIGIINDHLTTCYRREELLLS